MKLEQLRIQNFKSLRDVTLEASNDFLVFAGPQGSGKSNLVDVMDFMSRSLRLNPKEAVRHHGGWESVHNRGELESRVVGKASVGITVGARFKPHETISVAQKEIGYTFHIAHALRNDFLWNQSVEGWIDEMQSLQNVELDTQVTNGQTDVPFNIISTLNAEQLNKHNTFKEEIITSPEYEEASTIIQNIRTYRINPVLILQPSLQRFDNSELDVWGQNLALVLNRLEQNDELREQILEWMQMSVPELEQVRTIEQKLDGHVGMLFKFKGYEKEFPPHLISEGTMYLLCMLVAVLDRPEHGITIIEEPERGLHPYLIQQLVEFFREESKKAPIWLTTHSETLIRGLKPQELMLMDKLNGETILKSAKNYQSNGLSLDRAWLSNVLDGGLPW